MTSRIYFGKMNSTIGSVVPLAMFFKSRQKTRCCWALGNRAISSKIHLKKFSTTFPLCIVCSNKLSQGPCESTCPGVEIGMYSGFGVFRATNKGGCNHDFFRCCKVHFVIMSQLQNRVPTFWAHKDASYTILPNSSSGCQRNGLGWVRDKKLLQPEVLS